MSHHPVFGEPAPLRFGPPKRPTRTRELDKVARAMQFVAFTEAVAPGGKFDRTLYALGVLIERLAEECNAAALDTDPAPSYWAAYDAAFAWMAERLTAEVDQ